MVARVTFLVAFACLFGAVWNSDRPQNSTLIAATKNRRAAEHSFGSREIRRSSDVTRPVEIPVPSHLLAGTYRVIDERGRVGWVTVATTKTASGEASNISGEAVTVHQTDSGFLYFIRVDAAQLATIPANSPTLR